MSNSDDINSKNIITNIIDDTIATFANAVTFPSF